MKRSTKQLINSRSTFTNKHTQYRGYHIEAIRQPEGNLYLISRATKTLGASRKLADAKRKIDDLINNH